MFSIGELFAKVESTVSDKFYSVMSFGPSVHEVSKKDFELTFKTTFEVPENQK